MTRDEIRPYVRAVADRVGLAHWTIEVKDEPPADSDAYASVNCWHGRHGASVRVSDALLAETEAEQRYCVVHELVHCHMAHADALAGKELAGRALEAWTLAFEYAVDALSQVIARSVPLPSELSPTPAGPEVASSA